MVPRNPSNAWIASEVGSLTLGKRRGRPDGLFPRRHKRASPFGDIEELPIPDRLASRATKTGSKTRDLAEQPGIKHLVESDLDPLAELATGVDADGRERSARLVGPDPLRLRRCGPVGWRCVGQSQNLDGTEYAPRVRKIDHHGSARVCSHQFRSQHVNIGLLELNPHRVIGWGELERINQRSEVEARSAGDHNVALACDRRIEDLVSGPLELRSGVFLRRVGHIDKVVGESVAGSCVGLCRTDVHPAKHLHRVDREDLCAKAVSDRLRQIGLPGRSGPEDGVDAQAGTPSR